MITERKNCALGYSFTADGKILCGYETEKLMLTVLKYCKIYTIKDKNTVILNFLPTHLKNINII